MADDPGGADLAGRDVSAEALLERADNAMYQAKKTGGNACRFSGLDPSSD
ncbi:hypothetical protein [Pseudomonas arsenicoxydans]|nr:hypothetical protein [Pseudomonas arsenicoxydans]